MERRPRPPTKLPVSITMPALIKLSIMLVIVDWTRPEGKSSGGFINDIDDGLPFWPDGQTDDCIYMIRTVTEMRETVKRTGSSRQKDLIKFLDDPKVFERDYVMIVARP